MPYHQWGDDWFEKNGNDLWAAVHFCIKNWKRWGRLGSHGKEKFGTFRHHCYFFFNYEPCQELLYPGYVRSMLYKWFRPIDRNVMAPLVKYTGLRFLIIKWQGFIYNLVLQIACKKWPHLIDEIVSDCDWPEVVKLPFGFGVNGIDIRNKYWEPKLDQEGNRLDD